MTYKSASILKINTLWSIITLFLLQLFVSCAYKSNQNPIGNKRTVLVYIAADNNLSSFSTTNIYYMNSSFDSNLSDVNLIAFVDNRNGPPCMVKIDGFNQIDTIYKYVERNSSDPEVLRDVIDYTLEHYAAESYGLIMWSHGTGWIPTKQLHYVAPNLSMAPSRDNHTPRYSSVVEWQRQPFSYMTKAFGFENDKSGGYSCMEIDEMAAAIPDNVFDYIAFDACYMANIEVVYALRNKARYIISSCYEIVADGFPYQNVTQDFLSGNLMQVCRKFFSYYNQKSDWTRMAGISLVKTEDLDSLAMSFSKIVAAHKDIIPKMDVSTVQCFDRYRNNVSFDLDDFVFKLKPSNELYNEFKYHLDKCVIFKVSTPYIFPGERYEIKVDKYSGLSIYIPLQKYEASGLNRDYRETEWSKATGY